MMVNKPPKPSILLPPLSLYIHIPWCVKKCPYCDFNSHRQTGALPEAQYVQSVLADLRQSQHLAQQRKIHSIFIGGGTPSLFSAKALGEILAGAESLFGFCDDIEITLEANPGTAEQQRFADYRLAGINRLSIGVQSFSDVQLKALGRIHDGKQATTAIDMARLAGFDNFNLDLMHGLPQQDIPNALADLQQAISLEPSHLSWYQLTIEANTEFHKRPPLLPVEDLLADIQTEGLAVLTDAGFKQYEVSAYSKSRPSQHNMNYWSFGDYIGVGAGAHGKISHGDTQLIERIWKTRQPEHYMNTEKSFIAGQENVSVEQRPIEFMMNALRLNEGVEARLYEQRTGLLLSDLEPTLNKLRDQGLITENHQRLQATALGQRFLNNLIDAFIAD